MGRGIKHLLGPIVADAAIGQHRKRLLAWLNGER
jgi:hypothetical protein